MNERAFSTLALAAQQQHYPTHTLYMVATPIGNLADISARALHLLSLADTLACEDTRHTSALLRSLGIERATGSLIALHQHNEAAAAERIMELLHAGHRVAFVSDAGTPGISDPGARLAAAVAAAGLRCVPVPGASSPAALISAAGCVSAAGGAATSAQDFAEQGFVFAGFLPTKPKARDAALAAIAHERRAHIVLEAPHRIAATVAAIATALPTRRLTIGRELTKQFEQIATMAAANAPAWLAADTNRCRGEFALLIHPAEAENQKENTQNPMNAEARRILEILLQSDIRTKQAAQIAAHITGENAKMLYQWALDIRNIASTDAQT